MVKQKKQGGWPRCEENTSGLPGEGNIFDQHDSIEIILRVIKKRKIRSKLNKAIIDSRRQEMFDRNFIPDITEEGN